MRRTLLIFIFLMSQSHLMNGTTLTALDILFHKAQIILDNADKNTDSRRESCFRFKNYLSDAKLDHNEQIQTDAILKLRDICADEQLRKIFLKDLGDPSRFVSHTMCKAEMSYLNLQNTNDLFVNYGFTNLVVQLEIARGGCTGILIPTLSPENIRHKRPFTWRILTCAHAIPEILLDGDNDVEMGIRFNADTFVPIKYFTIFKKNGRDTALQGLPINTIQFPKLLSIHRFDKEGDIAWCRFDEENDGLHNWFTKYTGVSQVNQQSNSITFQVGTGSTVTKYEVHFTNTLLDAQILDLFLNLQPKNSNFSAGYSGLEGSSLTIVKARDDIIKTSRQFYKLLGNELDFIYDAPSYHGMSGGPIFNIDTNQRIVKIVGVVSGGSINPSSGAMINRAAFIKFF